MAPCGAGAVKNSSLLQRDLFPGRNEDELILIRGRGVEVVGLVADRDPRPAGEDVVVVVDDLLPWAAVDHCLVSLDAGPLLAFVRRDRHRAKLDSLDDLVTFR